MLGGNGDERESMENLEFGEVVASGTAHYTHWLPKTPSVRRPFDVCCYSCWDVINTAVGRRVLDFGAQSTVSLLTRTVLETSWIRIRRMRFLICSVLELHGRDLG